MIKLFNYLLILNIFAGGFVLFFSPFEFYLGYIFIISFLLYYFIHFPKIRVKYRHSVIIPVILILSSLANVFLGNDTIFLLMKQVFGILITGIAYYLLVKINDYKIDSLFRIYLRIALIVAAIGIFQELSFLFGFKIGYDYGWFIQKWSSIPATGGMLRVNSIFAEPTHLATSMAPALFVSLTAIIKKNSFYLTRKAAIAIILCYILTFSAIAYLAILISVLLICLSAKKSVWHLSLVTLVAGILLFGAYRYMPEIRMRVDDTVGVATGSMEVTRSHLTVYAYISNGYVALKSFMNSPLFGHGLGSHPVSYDKYINPGISTMFWQQGYTGVNKNDANSLLLRLISETGYFGLMVVLYFLFRFHLKLNLKENMPMLNNAVLILFIIQLLRQGHYFYNGLFFFVWMYYFSYKINNREN